jgi:hypothetical protein
MSCFAHADEALWRSASVLNGKCEWKCTAPLLWPVVPLVNSQTAGSSLLVGHMVSSSSLVRLQPAGPRRGSSKSPSQRAQVGRLPTTITWLQVARFFQRRREDCRKRLGIDGRNAYAFV